jgi:hypothetical protein
MEIKMCGGKIIRRISNDDGNVFIAVILDFSALTFSLFSPSRSFHPAKNVYH